MLAPGALFVLKDAARIGPSSHHWVPAHAASAHNLSEQQSQKAAAAPLLHAADTHALLLLYLSLPLQRSG